MKLFYLRSTLLFASIFSVAAAAAAGGGGGGDAKTCAAPALVDSSTTPPLVTPKIWLPTIIQDKYLSEMKTNDVVACCAVENLQECGVDGYPNYQTVKIGEMPQFQTDHALAVLDKAVQEGWKGGAGAWPQMTLQQRIDAIQKFLTELQKVRDEMIHVLQWEIGKNVKDATAEFDRTVQFAQQLIQTIQNDVDISGEWTTTGGTTHTFTRRAAIGVILCLAPFNYPINESYATILPALLMGNIIVLKIPAVGGLSHLLTMQAIQNALPPNTVNFISGSGRATMPPIMKTGKIDGLAFIGGSKAADALIHDHPHPHRLKVFLQLEAKNMGIFLSTLFKKENADALDHALKEAILGSLSYNGQRCTALKIFFVPKQHGSKMVEQFQQKVQALAIGLPWQTHGGEKDAWSQITPLPNQQRVNYMKELLQDALDKGAKVMNENGGTVVGGSNSTLMIPAVLYPVTPDMRLYTEEQFGPLIPIVEYDDIQTVLEYGQTGEYAQQVSIFAPPEDKFDRITPMIVDRFATVFGKINLNSQCGRSPDTVPFAGRRSSAMGVMSVKDALLEFSVPTVVSYKGAKEPKLVEGLQVHSSFLQPVHNDKTRSETYQ